MIDLRIFANGPFPESMMETLHASLFSFVEKPSEVVWWLCLSVVFVLFALMLVIGFTKSLKAKRLPIVLIGAVLAGILIYIPPFWLVYRQNIAAMVGGLVINLLQIISLDADFLQFFSEIKSLFSSSFMHAYYLALVIVHLLLPSVFAATAVKLIMRWLSKAQLGILHRGRKNLYIFSEVNYKSQMLAADIRKREPKAVIAFLEDNSDLDHAALREKLQCTILYEKMENIKVRAARRKVQYYCIGSDESRNLNTALAVVSYLTTHSIEEQRNNTVFLFSRDPQIELMVDSMVKGVVDLEVINEDRQVVYELLERHMLTDVEKDGVISVLISGFSPLAQEFLRAVAWCGQISGMKMVCRVLVKDGKNAAADFKSAHPGLFTDRYDIRFLHYANDLEYDELLRDQCKDAGYIVVCDDTEAASLDQAIKLRRFFYRMDSEFSAEPYIFVNIQNAEKARTVANLHTAEAKAERRMPYHIIPFGVVSEEYTYDAITDSYIEKLAKNVHLVYEDIFSDGEIDPIDAMSRYNLFEVNKRSNRANALHIRYKLAMLGLDYSDDPNAEEVQLSDYLTEQTLLELTYAEHDRWMAFLESEGWITAELHEVKAYQASGLSKGRHNCPLLKMHPYICAFDVLKMRSDAMGLPDSTVYDRDLITRIPDILHDRWKMAGKTYKIVKKNR